MHCPSIQDGCFSPDICKAEGECHYTGTALDQRNGRIFYGSSLSVGDGLPLGNAGSMQQGAQRLPIMACTPSGAVTGAVAVGISTDGEYLPGDPQPTAPAPVEPPGAFSADMHTHTMPANPKQHYGDTKVPLHLFPMTAIVVGAMGMLEGREKYGQDNMRAAPVEAMTYVRAAMSHILSYAEGEWTPNDSLVPHLGLALDCVAILIDAHYAGSLIDNRKFPGGYQKAIAEMQPLVQKIRDMHADKSPYHYTIKDAV